MPSEPIKSQKEFDKVFASVAKQTAEGFGIPLVEAEKRVEALRKSGILKHGGPDDPESRMRITAFLSIPSSTYAHIKDTPNE